jgi:hypothetical protein
MTPELRHRKWYKDTDIILVASLNYRHVQYKQQHFILYCEIPKIKGNNVPMERDVWALCIFEQHQCDVPRAYYMLRPSHSL